MNDITLLVSGAFLVIWYFEAVPRLEVASRLIFTALVLALVSKVSVLVSVL